MWHLKECNLKSNLDDVNFSGSKVKQFEYEKNHCIKVVKIYWINSTFKEWVKIRYINYARRSANLMIQRKSSIECFENNINFIFCNWNFIELFLAH